VFREVPFGFAVRLWNGAQIHLGPKGEPFTLVFRNREIFRRLVLRPNTLRFAVAFADGDIDVEGDLFTALRLANRVEALRLGLRDRLAILVALARL
jgi:cyclopropane-fatty-acyl-phospholipid synthase